MRTRSAYRQVNRHRLINVRSEKIIESAARPRDYGRIGDGRFGLEAIDGIVISLPFLESEIAPDKEISLVVVVGGVGIRDGPLSTDGRVLESAAFGRVFLEMLSQLLYARGSQDVYFVGGVAACRD